MKIGDVFWVWNSSGEIVKGAYIGEDNGWLKIHDGDYTLFKKPHHIFKDLEVAEAWQIVNRFKRFLKQGVPPDLIISVDDKPALEKAMELFPEELI